MKLTAQLNPVMKSNICLDLGPVLHFMGFGCRDNCFCIYFIFIYNGS
jgi:hypothetical protein